MAALILSTLVRAQDSTHPRVLTISGYLEIYYSYDGNRPASNTKPGFIYNFNRNNEVNINLGYIKAAYRTDKLRANLAIGAGTYMNANYSSEPGVLKNIYEANAGVSLSKNNRLWIDAGVFSSHIGFASAIGKDCWTLTRSLVAENTPYYETGAKLGYTSKNNKWFLSALLVNGWQHIQKPDGNTTPALGTQVTYTPSAGVSFNYSTFIGNEQPDSARLMRYYQNMYAIIQFSDRLGLIASFDYGLQQKSRRSRTMNSWYAPVLILKYQPDSKNSFTARGEYYRDPEGVIVSGITAHGFETSGWSLNYDRAITTHAVWRIEFRKLQGKDEYFIDKDNSTKKVGTYVTTSIAMSF
jgi:hypothetical protein